MSQTVTVPPSVDTAPRLRMPPFAELTNLIEPCFLFIACALAFYHNREELHQPGFYGFLSPWAGVTLILASYNLHYDQKTLCTITFWYKFASPPVVALAVAPNTLKLNLLMALAAFEAVPSVLRKAALVLAPVARDCPGSVDHALQIKGVLREYDRALTGCSSDAGLHLVSVVLLNLWYNGTSAPARTVLWVLVGLLTAGSTDIGWASELKLMGIVRMRLREAVNRRRGSTTLLGLLSSSSCAISAAVWATYARGYSTDILLVLSYWLACLSALVHFHRIAHPHD